MDLFKIKKAAVSGLTALLAALFLAAGALAADLPSVLVPVGECVGISLKTRGVMVSELSEFEDNGVKVAPARDAGIIPGDVITMIDGWEIASAGDMMAALERAGEQVTVRVERDGEERQVTVTPYPNGETRCLGVWVRDSLSGIGTVTYYDPETGAFGALGHSIADGVTGVLVPLREGAISPAKVTGVTKSEAGSPGQLGGVFDVNERLGEIEKNCQLGIFGVITGEMSQSGLIPVAEGSEVKAGRATILSDVSGERREYGIEIVRVYSDSPDSRDMMIRVTDEELLALTGGIVQGMSGSPILQNGKLIGAVTHVLINDPHKGYGVFVENMIKAA